MVALRTGFAAMNASTVQAAIGHTLGLALATVKSYDGNCSVINVPQSLSTKDTSPSCGTCTATQCSFACTSASGNVSLAAARYTYQMTIGATHSGSVSISDSAIDGHTHSTVANDTDLGNAYNVAPAFAFGPTCGQVTRR